MRWLDWLQWSIVVELILGISGGILLMTSLSDENLYRLVLAIFVLEGARRTGTERQKRG